MKIATEWEISDSPIQYDEAILKMESYVQNMLNAHASNKIWLLEHFDVYTYGTSAQQSELLNNGNHIDVIKTNRGGKFTYHGLGQRIIYPMLDISAYKDVKLYVSFLERWIIATLEDCNIEPFKKEGMIGIWTIENGYEKKIAALGIRIKKWIAYHGISVNIYPDLSKFSAIVPCGISEFGVTSLHNLKKDVSFSEFDKILETNFLKVFS